jgi:hypothetical protein
MIMHTMWWKRGGGGRYERRSRKCSEWSAGDENDGDKIYQNHVEQTLQHSNLKRL